MSCTCVIELVELRRGLVRVGCLVSTTCVQDLRLVNIKDVERLLRPLFPGEVVREGVGRIRDGKS